jgi:hypothetical protein
MAVMGYYPYPYPGYGPPPPQAQRSPSDLGGSITLIVLTVLSWGFAAFFGLFLLAFLDHCPPATCSADGAMLAIGSALLVAAVIAVIGVTITVVRLVRRKTAWPIALGTLLLCLAAYVCGIVGYFVSVGTT